MRNLMLATILALGIAGPVQGQQTKDCTAVVSGGHYRGCGVRVFNHGQQNPVVSVTFPWNPGTNPPGILTEGQCGVCQAAVRQALRDRFRNTDFPFFGLCRDPSGHPNYCLDLLGPCVITNSCGVEPFDCDRPQPDGHQIQFIVVGLTEWPLRVKALGNSMVEPPTFEFMSPAYQLLLEPDALDSKRHETSFGLVAYHSDVSEADCSTFPRRRGSRLGLDCRTAQGLFAARMPDREIGEEDRLSGSIAYSEEPSDLYMKVAQRMRTELAALVGINATHIRSDGRVPARPKDASVQLVAWTEEVGVAWVAMPELENAAGSFFASRYLAFVSRTDKYSDTARPDGNGGWWSTWEAPDALGTFGVEIVADVD